MHSKVPIVPASTCMSARRKMSTAMSELSRHHKPVASRQLRAAEGASSTSWSHEGRYCASWAAQTSSSLIVLKNHGLASEAHTCLAGKVAKCATFFASDSVSPTRVLNQVVFVAPSARTRTLPQSACSHRQSNCHAVQKQPLQRSRVDASLRMQCKMRSVQLQTRGTVPEIGAGVSVEVW